MSEDELTKKLKKMMSICTILQRKVDCRCAKNEKVPFPFCSAVEELYKELTNDCLNCELYKEAHEPKAWR